MGTENPERKVDLTRHTRSLVSELRQLDWDRTTEKILSQIIRRHDEEVKATLEAELRPRVVGLNLEGHPRALVKEVWAELCWHGDGPTKPSLREMVERHFKALAAELQPRVPLEKLEEISRRIGKLHFSLMPEHCKVMQVLREELWGKEPTVWSVATPYPDTWVDPKQCVPRDKDKVWLLLDDSIIPQALGCRTKGKWSSVELRGGCWIEDKTVLGWCALKQSSEEEQEEVDG